MHRTAPDCTMTSQKNVPGPTKDWLNLNTAGTLQLPYDRKSWKTACTLALMPSSGNGPSWWWLH